MTAPDSLPLRAMAKHLDEQEAVASLVRRLRAQTWLVGGRDDELIEAVHRHAAAVRSALGAVGCAMTVEPDLVRVHTPVEPVGLMPGGAAPEGVWLWLTVAVLESLPPGSGWDRWWARCARPPRRRISR
ncbi:uncharacterized protein DUF2398 [Streptomyces sp. 3212.3]|uniref:DUF2398 family protein n=1 Tax=unclassified Streptomyces TaxID=2593676 RepID=UPI000E2326D0|nr:uncharacterized protein DUF2398 [Streptomyces sp. 3212.3]